MINSARLNKEVLVTVGVKLPPLSMIKKIDAIAEKHGITRSYAIRQLIKIGLKEYYKNRQRLFNP